MDKWHETLNEAINKFYSGQPEQALEIFRQLLDTEKGGEHSTDLKIWIARCYKDMKKLNETWEIINDLESEDFMHSGDTQDRITTLKADIAIQNNDFPLALAFYREMLDSSTNYYDLEHLEFLICEVISMLAYYKEHGTVEDWKQELYKKIDEALSSLQE